MSAAQGNVGAMDQRTQRKGKRRDSKEKEVTEDEGTVTSCNRIQRNKMDIDLEIVACERIWPVKLESMFKYRIRMPYAPLQRQSSLRHYAFLWKISDIFI